MIGRITEHLTPCRKQRMSFTREQARALDYYLTTDPNDDRPWLCTLCDAEIDEYDHAYYEGGPICYDCADEQA